jgi:hypothetical protein
MTPDNYPVPLSERPSCQLTKQYENANGEIRYQGADGELYEKHKDGSWWRVKP